MVLLEEHRGHEPVGHVLAHRPLAQRGVVVEAESEVVEGVVEYRREPPTVLGAHEGAKVRVGRRRAG